MEATTFEHVLNVKKGNLTKKIKCSLSVLGIGITSISK